MQSRSALFYCGDSDSATGRLAAFFFAGFVVVGSGTFLVFDGPKKPLMHVIGHGLQAAIVNPLTVDGRHIVASLGVAHDGSGCDRIAGGVTDRLERVAKRVKPQALAIDRDLLSPAFDLQRLENLGNLLADRVVRRVFSPPCPYFVRKTIPLSASSFGVGRLAIDFFRASTVSGQSGQRLPTPVFGLG